MSNVEPEKQLNNRLHIARAGKKDEFYTQITDIEKELSHYKAHFRDKIIFCNCDDPEESNFWRYFSLNFEHLGLKKLIATHYEEDKPSYKLEITVDRNLDGKVDQFDTVKTPLSQNGDFRSDECAAILKEADIVITNPPFSLFREYVEQLIEHGKQFLIIGNQNAITYKETFQHIMNNTVWTGVDNGGTKWFQVPDDYEIKTQSRIKIVDGVKFFSMGSIYWFTNIPHTKRNEKLILYKKYNGNESCYPKFDNYDAINVNRVADIPADYSGAMAVPITFIDKYNPSQFEIISCNDVKTNDATPFKEHGLIKDKDSGINGKPTYVRIVIKRKDF